MANQYGTLLSAQNFIYAQAKQSAALQSRFASTDRRLRGSGDSAAQITARGNAFAGDAALPIIGIVAAIAVMGIAFLIFRTGRVTA